MVDTALVRAASHTVESEPTTWPDLTGTSAADVERWRDWIKQAWSQELIAQAVEDASPLFAERVQAVLEGRVHEPRLVRRVTSALIRYLLRSRYRATPFGLFAGVAPARFGQDLVVRWGAGHRAVARVDAAWLTDVVAGLERCPELVRRLPVMVDPAHLVRGGRLIIPCQQAGTDGAQGPAEVSLRYTPAVAKVLEVAQAPVRASALAQGIAHAYPEVAASAVDGLLGELIDRRVLLTGLRPPMTATDPLGHVIAALSVADAASIPEVASTVAALAAVHETLAAHDRAVTQAQLPLRRAAHLRMTKLPTAEVAATGLDLRLDCDLVLPAHVAKEAERALGAITRLTPFPFGTPAWRDYHGRFLDRYGPGAMVPLRDLVDPDIGLGFPAGYRGSTLDRPPPRLTPRDDRLLALAQRAALDGAREIVLDDHLLDELSDPAARDDAATLPAHLELCFHLHAPTPAALEGGGYELVVDGLSLAAGTLTGRFLDLLDPADRHRVATIYAELPTQDADAVRAQVSSPPLRKRTENVSRAAALLPHVISLGEHRSESDTTPLDDLAVSADTRRLFLISLRDGRRIEPAVFNAVELTNVAHPLARFLCELPRAGSAALIPFSWGAAATMPFLPRVRYGRAVLSPARWRLTTADLAPASACWAAWEDSMVRCRARYRLPEAVYLGAADQRLRLDLSEAAHLQLVRADLDRWGQVTLHEAPEPAAWGWFDGHAHEITAAFTVAQQPSLPKPSPPRRPEVIPRNHGHLPGGSGWAFVKLYGHPDRATTILTAHLPTLLDAWDTPPAMWFIRYRDPDPHLRLRFRLTGPDDFAPVARRVADWATRLRENGFVARVQWDTYLPETGRYGTGPAMAAAEAVFTADSTAALAQLLHAGPGRAAVPVTVASFIDLAISFTGNLDQAMRWLGSRAAAQTGPALDRAVRTETLRLADPHEDFAQLRAIPGGSQIACSWIRRREALSDYRQRLDAGGGPDPGAVLNSLLHMHHIRMNGLDEPAEQECRRLARATALAWTARNRP
ncbi:hypothetical protein UK82_24780 [Frankia sp. ACN1ag]|nr:hypothetical protein UK82_24780 [Frankia sp. ACN1ag]